jgi:hypothetical protein
VAGQLRHGCLKPPLSGAADIFAAEHHTVIANSTTRHADLMNFSRETRKSRPIAAIRLNDSGRPRFGK